MGIGILLNASEFKAMKSVFIQFLIYKVHSYQWYTAFLVINIKFKVRFRITINGENLELRN